MKSHRGLARDGAPMRASAPARDAPKPSEPEPESQKGKPSARLFRIRMLPVFLVACIAALVIPVVLGAMSGEIPDDWPKRMLLVVGLGVPFCALFAFILRAKIPVAVGTAGISAPSVAGTISVIPWSEIGGSKRVPFINIMLVWSRTSPRVILVVPLFLAELPKFHEALGRYAPSVFGSAG